MHKKILCYGNYILVGEITVFIRKEMKKEKLAELLFIVMAIGKKRIGRSGKRKQYLSKCFKELKERVMLSRGKGPEVGP